MNYEMKYPVRLNLRLDEQMHDHLAQAASKLNMSQAQFIRLVLYCVLDGKPQVA